MLIITIPKGRNFLNSIILLKKIKIFIIEIIYRKILLKTNRKKIFIILLKNKDLLKIIKIGISKIIVLGTDLLLNKKIIIFLIKKINSILFINNKNTIITKFFNVINYYFLSKFLVKMNGTLEFFLNFKKYGILDITETNKTLYENNFFPIIFLKKIYLTIICEFYIEKIFNNIIKKC